MVTGLFNHTSAMVKGKCPRNQMARKAANNICTGIGNIAQNKPTATAARAERLDKCQSDGFCKAGPNLCKDGCCCSLLLSGIKDVYHGFAINRLDVVRVCARVLQCRGSAVAESGDLCYLSALAARCSARLRQALATPKRQKVSIVNQDNTDTKAAKIKLPIKKGLPTVLILSISHSVVTSK